MLEAQIRPRGPYSLRLSARGTGDATRRFADGVLHAALAPEGRHEQGVAWQRLDGSLCLRAESEEGLDQLRFILALEDDTSEFLRLFRGDRLLGEPIRQLRGLRPLRTATVAHALLRAVAGQLIEARRARTIERRIICAATSPVGELHAPPSAGDLRGFSPAELAAFDLGARKSAALVRLCRGLDLEALRCQPTDAVARRLERERGIGPWSVGVICIEGLGRRERGLIRDLGLVKLASALAGRRVEPEESDRLLEPYGEWAGLASVYLLAGYHLGLVGLRDAYRDSRHRQDRRVAPGRAA